MIASDCGFGNLAGVLRRR